MATTQHERYSGCSIYTNIRTGLVWVAKDGSVIFHGDSTVAARQHIDSLSTRRPEPAPLQRIDFSHDRRRPPAIVTMARPVVLLVLGFYTVCYLLIRFPPWEHRGTYAIGCTVAILGLLIRIEGRKIEGETRG